MSPTSTASRIPTNWRTPLELTGVGAHPATTAVNNTTVGMVATTAVDASGPVQYYFENTTNSSNSGWITSTTWNNTGLTNAVSYDFRFKARDAKSNETGWSAVLSATPGNDVQNATPASDVTASYRWSKDLAAFNASGATDGAGTTVTFTTQLNTPSAGITTATATGTATSKLLVDVKVTQN